MTVQYQEAVLALYTELLDGTIEGLGSGVIVAAWGDRALALTANHNGQYLSRKAVSRTNLFRDLPAARAYEPNFVSFVRTAIGQRTCEGECDQLDVPGLRVPPEDAGDVAVAPVLKRHNGKHGLRDCLPIKPLPPEPGETVLVTGFYGHRQVGERSGGITPFHVDCVSWPAHVVAPEDEVGSLTKGPRFEVDIEFPSGLSGAPVICTRDNSPFVCGVVSSSMAGSGRGTIAAATPILALPMPGELVGLPEGTFVPLIELVHRQLMPIYLPDLAYIDVKASGDGTYSVVERS